MSRKMADVISLADVLRERRRAEREEQTATCVEIIEASLQHVLILFHSGPTDERTVRARQARQLAELLEYVTERL